MHNQSKVSYHVLQNSLLFVILQPDEPFQRCFNKLQQTAKLELTELCLDPSAAPSSCIFHVYRCERHHSQKMQEVWQNIQHDMQSDKGKHCLRASTMGNIVGCKVQVWRWMIGYILCTETSCSTFKVRDEEHTQGYEYPSCVTPRSISLHQQAEICDYHRNFQPPHMLKCIPPSKVKYIRFCKTKVINSQMHQPFIFVIKYVLHFQWLTPPIRIVWTISLLKHMPRHMKSHL